MVGKANWANYDERDLKSQIVTVQLFYCLEFGPIGCFLFIYIYIYLFFFFFFMNYPYVEWVILFFITYACMNKGATISMNRGATNN